MKALPNLSRMLKPKTPLELEHIWQEAVLAGLVEIRDLLKDLNAEMRSLKYFIRRKP